MTDWGTILLTAFITTFLGVVALIFNKWFIEPYFKFKEKLTEVKICLLFYRNILTNKFIREQTNEEFTKKIISSLNLLRNEWAELSVAYSRIYSNKFSLAKIPSYLEMENIEKKLLDLSNRMHEILVSKNSRDIDTCLERDKIVSEVIKFTEKYY